MTHPIETAVAHLKEDAMKRAEDFARERIAKAIQQLEEVGMDRDLVAPYPSAMKEDRKSYAVKLGRYRFFCSITKTVSGMHSFKDPRIVTVEEDKIEKVVAETREMAAAQYDAFVAKLINKTGEGVISAELTGNHVWGYSKLRVLKEGSEEIWKTQTIINVSKLGKVFNQFPTRKVKN